MSHVLAHYRSSLFLRLVVPLPSMTLLAQLIPEEQLCKVCSQPRAEFIEQRLQESDRLREEGNALLITGHYSAAIKQFISAIWHASVEEALPHHRTESEKRISKALANLAHAWNQEFVAKTMRTTNHEGPLEPILLSQENSTETSSTSCLFLAKRAASLALQITRDPELSSKLFFRRATAQLKLGEFKEAAVDLESAQKLQPNDLKISALLSETKEQFIRSRLKWTEQNSPKSPRVSDVGIGSWLFHIVTFGLCRRRHLKKND